MNCSMSDTLASSIKDKSEAKGVIARKGNIKILI